MEENNTVSAITTQRLRADEEGIASAGALLRAGKLVAIPTETVYGLAANAFNGDAVASIFRAKGRPADNPLIVHISRMEQLAQIVAEFPSRAALLAKAFWPGALTMILPKTKQIPDEVSAGLQTVAVRFPSHPVARRVIEAAGVALAAPSANSSGRPSPTCAAHVLADMDGKIDAVLDGGSCGVGLESTVISLLSKTPRLLRPGGVTPEQLRDVLGEIEIDPAVVNRLEEGREILSPGLKYKHYAPAAQVTLVCAGREEYARFVNDHAQPGVFALCFDEDAPLLQIGCVSYGGERDEAAQAQHVFNSLRELDARGAKVVYAHAPRPQGIGLAVYNRMIRAAAFRVVTL